jgi:hypothetical protein
MALAQQESNKYKHKLIISKDFYNIMKELSNYELSSHQDDIAVFNFLSLKKFYNFYNKSDK